MITNSFFLRASSRRGFSVYQPSDTRDLAVWLRGNFEHSAAERSLSLGAIDRLLSLMGFEECTRKWNWKAPVRSSALIGAGV